MRWRLGRRSQNVEDRRGMGTPVGMRFPGGVRMPGGLGRGRGGIARGGGIGVVGLLILLAIGWFLGIDPSFLLAGQLDRRALSGGAAGGSAAGRRPAARSSSRSCSPTPRTPGTQLFDQMTAELPRADARAVLRRGPVGLRLRPGGDGPVLLPGRPEGLHRPRLLRRAAHALRRARATSPRPT